MSLCALFEIAFIPRTWTREVLPVTTRPVKILEGLMHGSVVDQIVNFPESLHVLVDGLMVFLAAGDVEVWRNEVCFVCLLLESFGILLFAREVDE